RRGHEDAARLRGAKEGGWPDRRAGEEAERRSLSAFWESSMGKLRALIVVLSGILILRPARAGHEFPIYPSYYPQEIRIESIDPGAAPRLLLDGSIHAYVGDIPEPGASKPESISFVESLGSYLRVVVNPAKARERSCAIVRSVAHALAHEAGDFVFH